MTYILYGTPGSGSTIIEMALSEIGVSYEHRRVSLRERLQLEPAYGAVNPQRKLPSLITPKGETLTESVAILLTLHERHRKSKLLPRAGSAQRALALRWLLFTATELYPIVEINDYPERFTAPTNRDVKATRKLARTIWRTRLQLVEQAIDDGPYLLGAEFTLTDLYIAVVSRWAEQGRWRPKHVPKIERLADTVARRSGCEAIWQRAFENR